MTSRNFEQILTPPAPIVKLFFISKALVLPSQYPWPPRSNDRDVIYGRLLTWRVEAAMRNCIKTHVTYILYLQLKKMGSTKGHGFKSCHIQILISKYYWLILNTQTEFIDSDHAGWSKIILKGMFDMIQDFKTKVGNKRQSTVKLIF